MLRDTKLNIKNEWETTVVWDEERKAFVNDYDEEFSNFNEFVIHWIGSNYGNSGRGQWLYNLLKDWEVQ